LATSPLPGTVSRESAATSERAFPLGALALTAALYEHPLVLAGALAGIVLSLVWIDAPRWLSAVLYVVLGWVSVVVVPQLWDRAGVMAVALLATGGVLYTMGAVIYARRRPDPAPRVFGYHEVFHAFVILAATAHFAAVALATI
jgi:hemolysin III